MFNSTGKILGVVFALFLFAAVAVFAWPQADDFSSNKQSDQTSESDLPRELEGRRAEILTAFFGLDGSERFARAGRRFCGRSSGTDGMPLVFSHELDVATIEAGDINVVLLSGQSGQVSCVSLAPAIDPGELRTLLLIGEFGSAEEDPPVRVDVVGNLHSLDGRVNFRGASVGVTALSAGASLAFAQIIPQGAWRVDQTPASNSLTQTNCPQDDLKQIIRVVWDGGVKPVSDEGIEPEHAALYRVTLEMADGSTQTASPFAIGNTGDNDNNHELCMNTKGRPVSVFFPAGHLVDPNHDVNADSLVEIQN